MVLGVRVGCLAAVAAAMLAGCGSTVKLDEAPVENRTPTATNNPADGGSGKANVPPPGQSTVGTVDLTKNNTAAAAGLGRVVYFDFDSFVVKDEYRALIESHAKALTGAKGKRMVVEGHTDERGGREYNLALGQKRAEAVVKSLALLGAPATNIEAVSFGKERPVDEGHDEAAWAKNRRAELKDR